MENSGKNCLTSQSVLVDIDSFNKTTHNLETNHLSIQNDSWLPNEIHAKSICGVGIIYQSPKIVEKVQRTRQNKEVRQKVDKSIIVPSFANVRRKLVGESREQFKSQSETSESEKAKLVLSHLSSLFNSSN